MKDSNDIDIKDWYNNSKCIGDNADNEYSNNWHIENNKG